MMTADEAREHIRSPLDLLVKHHVEQGASRMRAYERVGGLIGRAPAWVQRVIGRREDATVGLHDAFNIRAAYERLCKHIADGTDAIEAENQKLRRELDAALRGDRPASARVGGAPSAAEAPALRERVSPAPAPALAPSAAPRLRKKTAGALTELPLFGAMEPRP